MFCWCGILTWSLQQDESPWHVVAVFICVCVFTVCYSTAEPPKSKNVPHSHWNTFLRAMWSTLMARNLTCDTKPPLFLVPSSPMFRRNVISWVITSLEFSSHNVVNGWSLREETRIWRRRVCCILLGLGLWWFPHNQAFQLLFFHAPAYFKQTFEIWSFFPPVFQIRNWLFI